MKNIAMYIFVAAMTCCLTGCISKRISTQTEKGQYIETTSKLSNEIVENFINVKDKNTKIEVNVETAKSVYEIKTDKHKFVKVETFAGCSISEILAKIFIYSWNPLIWIAEGSDLFYCKDGDRYTERKEYDGTVDGNSKSVLKSRYLVDINDKLSLYVNGVNVESKNVSPNSKKFTFNLMNYVAFYRYADVSELCLYYNNSKSCNTYKPAFITNNINSISKDAINELYRKCSGEGSLNACNWLKIISSKKTVLDKKRLASSFLKLCEFDANNDGCDEARKLGESHQVSEILYRKQRIAEDRAETARIQAEQEREERRREHQEWLERQRAETAELNRKAMEVFQRPDPVQETLNANLRQLKQIGENSRQREEQQRMANLENQRSIERQRAARRQAEREQRQYQAAERERIAREARQREENRQQERERIKQEKAAKMEAERQAKLEKQREVEEARQNRVPLGSCREGLHQDNYNLGGGKVTLISCAEMTKGLGEQGVKWGIANNTGNSLQVKFTKRYIFSCGKETKIKANIQLKPYQSINGGFFSGDADLGDPLFPDEVCGVKHSYLKRVGVTNFSHKIMK
jgi:hypothetical protein